MPSRKIKRGKEEGKNMLRVSINKLMIGVMIGAGTLGQKGQGRA